MNPSIGADKDKLRSARIDSIQRADRPARMGSCKGSSSFNRWKSSTFKDKRRLQLMRETGSILIHPLRRSQNSSMISDEEKTITDQSSQGYLTGIIWTERVGRKLLLSRSTSRSEVTWNSPFFSVRHVQSRGPMIFSLRRKRRISRVSLATFIYFSVKKSSGRWFSWDPEEIDGAFPWIARATD